MQDLNELIEKMSGIRQSILSETSDLSDSKMVYEMKKTFLDKNGRIGQMMRFMREIDPSQRADFGQKVNELKNWAQNYFSSMDEKMKEKELEKEQIN